MDISIFFFFKHQPQGRLDDETECHPSFHSKIQLYFPEASPSSVGLFEWSRLEKKEHSFKGSNVSLSVANNGNTLFLKIKKISLFLKIKKAPTIDE